MKKLLIPIIIVILIIGGGGAAYKYFTGPKIIETTLTKSIDENGKTTAPAAAAFTPKDTIYLSARCKKLAIKKATVVWYKGEITKNNRFKVEENIEISKSGYFSSKLSVPEGLEEGPYGVTIYNNGNSIIEALVKFEVKN